MKIQKLTIDDTEVKEAVGAWLVKKGISLPVESVTKRYTHLSEWDVE